MEMNNSAANVTLVEKHVGEFPLDKYMGEHYKLVHPVISKLGEVSVEHYDNM